MTFHEAIDQFIVDMRAEGRINSSNTERVYRMRLNRHGQDVGNMDPALTSRIDVKATLAHWKAGNTRHHVHAILSSFYRWCMQEGLRLDNPAQQVRSTKRREPEVYKMTQEEVLRLLRVSRDDPRDYWMAHIGICAGLRATELCGLQGRHFGRRGWVWVSGGISKGMKERWIPVIADLEPVVVQIRDEVGEYERVLAPQKWHGPPVSRYDGYARERPLSYAGLHKLVVQMGQRAEITGRVTPHTMRHAFGDYVARNAGLRVAQALMGHKNIATTLPYTDKPNLDELAESMQGFRFGAEAG